MIRDISRKYYEVWGTEEAQNAFLKGILLILGALFLVQSVALVVLSLRRPVVVAVGESQTQILAPTPPSEALLETELKRQISRYIEVHYTWDFASIEKSYEVAAHFVSGPYQKAFQQSNTEQIKIVKDKRLSQRVYIANMNVDPKQLTAQVELDRILMVDGIRAITPLDISLSLESGPRTDSNPEGIYITGEKITN
jgi:hypothetical protein